MRNPKTLFLKRSLLNLVKPFLQQSNSFPETVITNDLAII